MSPSVVIMVRNRCLLRLDEEITCKRHHQSSGVSMTRRSRIQLSVARLDTQTNLIQFQRTIGNFHRAFLAIINSFSSCRELKSRTTKNSLMQRILASHNSLCPQQSATTVRVIFQRMQLQREQRYTRTLMRSTACFRMSKRSGGAYVK